MPRNLTVLKEVTGVNDVYLKPFERIVKVTLTDDVSIYLPLTYKSAGAIITIRTIVSASGKHARVYATTYVYGEHPNAVVLYGNLIDPTIDLEDTVIEFVTLYCDGSVWHVIGSNATIS